MISREKATPSKDSEALSELVIATSNLHKVREIRSLLRESKRFELYSLRDFPTYSPPAETGATFEANAILKATTAAKALNIWVLADDSGLVVPALKGSPGVLSARYAGEKATDKENREKLLKKMEGLQDYARSAYFECVMALASPEGLKKCVSGVCEGTITQEVRGGNGFGYDPIFIKQGYNFTFGQLEESVKNQISHRAKALQKMMLTLEQL